MNVTLTPQRMLVLVAINQLKDSPVRLEYFETLLNVRKSAVSQLLSRMKADRLIDWDRDGSGKGRIYRIVEVPRII